MENEKTIETENISEEILNYCGAVLIPGKWYRFLYSNGDVYEFVSVRENGGMKFQNDKGAKMTYLPTFWEWLNDGQIERVDEPVTWIHGKE